MRIKMDNPSKDIVSCLLRFIKFREALLLAQTNRFWHAQFGVEAWWELWFNQEFGRQPHPPTHIYCSYVIGPKRFWFERFQKFWMGRKKGRQEIKSDERFESSFYYRRLDKPCVFVNGCIDGIVPLIGDIILSIFHGPDGDTMRIAFYSPTGGEFMLDYSLRSRGSVPRCLWFPKIPFDYYWHLIVPCVVHIMMPRDYRDKLKFELDTDGGILSYTDPRLPGNSIHIQHKDRHPTIQDFGKLIVSDTFHAELWAVFAGNFFLAAIEVPH